eukprot:TRINITY_DN1304_c0_g1_i1.p1 TRINITY_DN1304_c0_g1~~TRINITY_DN1304_c0_g1_i1.p1  ORF type:complete len:240 (-),score=125.74 TRINITY_DN1304_c0_g1_i1:125-844(-)
MCIRDRMKVQDETKNKVALVKLEAQKKEQEAGAKIEAAKSAAQERMRKSERSQATQMAESKEGANKYSANNAADQAALEAAEAGVAKVKEVSQKASKLPEAQGNELLEKAKSSFREKVKDAENAPKSQTKYSKLIAPAEQTTVETVAVKAGAVKMDAAFKHAASLLELGEQVAPSVKGLAQTIWPLDRPVSGQTPEELGASPEVVAQAEAKAADVRGYMSAEDGNKLSLIHISEPTRPY